MVDFDDLRNRCGERIDAAFHPGDREGVLVVLGHGVTGNKDRPLLRAVAEGLSSRGWPCVRISFAGNGESEGAFEDSCISKESEDLRAVLDRVPEGVRVAYVGHSMGAAVGVLTAADDVRIRVLVSLAGMTHTAEFLRREFGGVVPGEGCMWDESGCPLSLRFAEDMERIGNVLDAAGRIACPWLIIHGSEDDVVPVSDGLDAFAAASCPREWLEIPGAGHSFGGECDDPIVEAMDRWFRFHM